MWNEYKIYQPIAMQYFSGIHVAFTLTSTTHCNIAAVQNKQVQGVNPASKLSTSQYDWTTMGYITDASECHISFNLPEMMTLKERLIAVTFTTQPKMSYIQNPLK